MPTEGAAGSFRVSIGYGGPSFEEGNFTWMHRDHSGQREVDNGANAVESMNERTTVMLGVCSQRGH
ncbi:hypothetical protein Ahy_A04g017637 isoform F [Arachis hypogaea]|uniref:Uncharacterized protein n=1 Tax=Arachis hypogaea TaxID=3818 RepID=A0A445DBQ2_ARAHY|nr:hypothetical protein Ahy_A04g017637 isoform F [Arachis hypogaea]